MRLAFLILFAVGIAAIVAALLPSTYEIEEKDLGPETNPERLE